MIAVYDLQTPQGKDQFQKRLDLLQSTASAFGSEARAVEEIVSQVREHGDEAVVRYMRQWTDPDFSADRICVTKAELEAGCNALDPQLRQALERAIDHVRRYQEHVKPADPTPVMIDGAELGMRYTPVDSAGLCVPGGAAVLFSTIIMLAVPAQVAGVASDQISVINPPPTRQAGKPKGLSEKLPGGDVSPIVLGTCHLLGIEKVYRVGGAQAVAALAYGTDQIQPVDMIAGPGNVFVQLAKQQVAGVCGTDGGFYGPSEIVTIADDSADPRYVASDLIAQAEHNPGKCFLVVWSKAVLDRILEELQTQTAKMQRASFIADALERESAALLVADEQQAMVIADTLAAEHVNLAVADPDAMLKQLRHGGEFFLGHQTPVAAGDYYAGPSHCLPTATTARFTSGISVTTFLKRSGTVCYRQGMSPTTIADIALLADAEGLHAHANSARVRG